MMQGAIRLGEMVEKTLGFDRARSKPGVAASQRDTVMLSGWGRVPRAQCQLFAPASELELRSLLSGRSSLIARGNGRAYGDAALNHAATVHMQAFNRILSIDEASGVVVCEAGALLADVIAAASPRGWFLPVVPGTKFVSIGGMVAADVHGKNHPHAGSFARHVCWIEMMIGDGSIVRCSATERPELFEATFGGMGLTGIVLRVAFMLMRIETPLMREETVRCDDLADTFAAFELNREAPYAVAWVDCLSSSRQGRSLVQFGRHASADAHSLREIRLRERKAARVPSCFPGFLASRGVVSALSNYLFSTSFVGTRLVPLERFFFPLDAIGDWNRLYGQRGMVQYQFAVSSEVAPEGIAAILRQMTGAGHAPLLAVLKRFGSGRGMMSFPMPGYTLALDFAARRDTVEFLAAFDTVKDLGGRIYLAKDAVSAPAHVAKTYPGLATFRVVRDRFDPQGRFSSLLSRRLEL